MRTGKETKDISAR